MDWFMIVVLCATVRGDFTVTSRSPNETVTTGTQEFKITIDQLVNPPEFPAFIHVYDGALNASILDLDVNSTDVQYDEMTLRFNVSIPQEWNTTQSIYITFDEGVFFSNATSNSSFRDDAEFWPLRIIRNNQSVSETTGFSTESPTTEVTTMRANTTAEAKRGERPPGRSAQWGLGLGIVLITLLLIGEIVFFKFFFRGQQQQRNSNYYP